MDKMILIDIETQDFSVTSGIYEVACLVVENFEIVDKLYLGKEIPNYKGIRNYGNGFYDISEDRKYMNMFQDLIKKYPYPLVAHNCPFDRKFLVYYEWIKEDYPTYCSMRALRNSNQQLDSYSLQNLIKHYGIAEQVEHNAMSDIENVIKY